MDQQQAIDPRIVSRIRKNLNLSRDGGATEAEAALAAEMAQKLMRKYNLSLAEVEAAGGEGQEGSKRIKETQQGKAQYEYLQQLMQACAEVNFCLLLRNQTRKGNTTQTTGFTIIGREANVISTRELFAYLNSTTERLAFEYVGGDNRQRLSRPAVSFKTGCAERLMERLRTRHREALDAQAREAREARERTAGGGSGTALVVSLTNFAQDEADRNNDLRWGRPEGTTARYRAQSQAADRLYVAALTALRHVSVLDREELMTRAAQAVPQPDGMQDQHYRNALQVAVNQRWDELQLEAKRAAETPAQKRKREEAEARADRQWWERYTRAERERASRTDHHAYRAGSEAGRNVGLDKQVNEGNTANNPRIR